MGTKIIWKWLKQPNFSEQREVVRFKDQEYARNVKIRKATIFGGRILTMAKAWRPQQAKDFPTESKVVKLNPFKKLFWALLQLVRRLCVYGSYLYYGTLNEESKAHNLRKRAEIVTSRCIEVQVACADSQGFLLVKKELGIINVKYSA